MADPLVRSGCVVELELRIFDEDGDELEVEADEPSLRYIHGAGDLLPGLERALEGRAIGSELEVTLAPEDAFGEVDPEGLVAVPRSEFPDDVELAPGDDVVVEVTEAESSEDEGELELRVVEVSEDGVLLDANHPLAGRTLTFRARVIAVREATPDELETGEVG